MVTDLDWLAWSFKSAIDGGQRPSKGVSYWLLICKANPRFPGCETCGFLWRIVGDAPWVALGALLLGALVKWNRGSPPFSSPWSKALAPRRFNTFQHVATRFEMFQRFSWISAVSNLVPSSGCSMFSWLAGRSWRHLKTLLVVGRDVLLIFSCKKGRGLPPDGSHDFSKAGNWSIIHLPSVRAEVNRPRCRHLSSTTGQFGRCRSRCSLPSASQPDIARRESEMLKSLAKVHALDFLQCYIFYHFLMILEHLMKTDIWGYPMMAVTAALGESEAWWFCVKATCLTSDLADLDRFGYLSMTKLDAEDFQLFPLASKVRW